VHRRMVAAFTLWFATIGAGSVILTRHVAEAGADAEAPTRWPTGSALPRAAGRATLLCFVHPMCPCTRATVRELERIVSRAPGAAVQVVFRDEPAWDASSSATWAMAGRVPGARRLRDPGGVEARRFGALTSGLVLLFDADGTLRFRGGVTASRGHEGDSAGGSALEAALRGRQGPSAWARVFGCGLVDR
jgi:hypothetical protein